MDGQMDRQADRADPSVFPNITALHAYEGMRNTGIVSLSQLIKFKTRPNGKNL